MMETQTSTFTPQILDALTEQIAVIDIEGDIVYVNKSWISFGRENHSRVDKDRWNSVNYLKVCDNSSRFGDSFATKAADGIRSVISGEVEVFYLEYPCHNPSEKRWFMMRVTPFALEDEKYIVLSH